MSNSYQQYDALMGMLTASDPTITNYLINTAAKYYAIPYLAPVSKTINKIKVSVGSVNGTLGATDMRCDIYSASTSAVTPNASLGNTTTVNATPTGAAFVEFSGLSVAVTAGTLYYIVIRNMNGTPGTNYFGVQYGGSTTSVMFPGGQGWVGSIQQSTNSGSTWSLVATGSAIPNARVGFSDSSYDGMVVSAGGADTTNIVYSTREVGVKFTAPVNASARIVAASMYFSRQSTPTGNAVYKLYNNTTLLGTSYEIPVGQIGSGVPGWRPQFFSSPIVIPAGATVRLTLAETANVDTNTKYYDLLGYTVDSDSNTLGLLPYQGSYSGTYSTNQGSSFSDTQTNLYPFALIPDNSQLFNGSGGNYAFA